MQNLHKLTLLFLQSVALIQQTCESERSALLRLCQSSSHCDRASLGEYLSEMCAAGDLRVMTLRAAQQLCLILGVVLLCCLLYVLLCVVEAVIWSVIGGDDQKKNRRD